MNDDSNRRFESSIVSNRRWNQPSQTEAADPREQRLAQAGWLAGELDARDGHATQGNKASKQARSKRLLGF